MAIPAEIMRPFDTIIGRWKTSGSVLDEHGAVVMTIEGTDEYEWMVGGHWVIHRVDVMMGEDHVQALEPIGEHDAETNSYSMRAFDGSGSFGTMTAHRGADGSWSIRGDGMRSTLWPSEDKPYMTAVWERGNEPGTWVRWMEMRFDPTS